MAAFAHAHDHHAARTGQQAANGLGKTAIELSHEVIQSLGLDAQGLPGQFQQLFVVVAHGRFGRGVHGQILGGESRGSPV